MSASSALPQDEPIPSGLRGYAYLLRRNPDARNIWSAQVVSQLGDWFNTVALLGLLVELTGNPASGNLISVAQIVPIAISGLFISGAIADRFNRKVIMVVADLLRAVIALSFLFIRSADTAWIAYAGTVAIALCTSFFQPASSAALPNVVSRRELPIAAMLGQTTFATMLFIGAFVGGAITAAFGRDVAFVLNALSFVVSAFFVLRTKANFNANRDRESLGGAGVLHVLTEGLRYLKDNPYVRSYVLAKPATAWALGGFGLFSTYSLTIYHAGDFGTSLLYAGRGLGAFISPLLISSIVSLQNTKPIKRFIRVGMLLVILGYGLFAFTLSPWLGMLCAAMAHWGNAWAMSLSGLIVQANTPDRVRGRVLALDSVGWSLVSSLSNLMVGFVAVRFSPEAGVLSAVGVTILTVALWMIGTRNVEQLKAPQPAATLAD